MLNIKHQIADDWKLAANVRHNETTSNALDLYISDSSALQNEVKLISSSGRQQGIRFK
jgi:hypothetical protein